MHLYNHKTQSQNPAEFPICNLEAEMLLFLLGDVLNKCISKWPDHSLLLGCSHYHCGSCSRTILLPFSSFLGTLRICRLLFTDKLIPSDNCELLSSHCAPVCPTLLTLEKSKNKNKTNRKNWFWPCCTPQLYPVLTFLLSCLYFNYTRCLSVLSLSPTVLLSSCNRKI